MYRVVRKRNFGVQASGMVFEREKHGATIVFLPHLVPLVFVRN